MNRLLVSILWIFTILCLNQSFGYFENKVYCDVKDKNITIFIKQKEWATKCQIYLDTIYQLAIKKYSEISSIRSYIDQWDDVSYWKKILEEKKSEFLQLVNYRTQIKTAVNKFELALFNKYYNLLQQPMQNYYSDLEIQYYILINQDPSMRSRDHSLKLAKLEQQMWNVSRILKAKNLDEIMEAAPSYIYLKKEIEWK